MSCFQHFLNWWCNGHKLFCMNHITLHYNKANLSAHRLQTLASNFILIWIWIWWDLLLLSRYEWNLKILIRPKEAEKKVRERERAGGYEAVDFFSARVANQKEHIFIHMVKSGKKCLEGVGQAGTDMWVYATLHQLPLPMRRGRQSTSMHSQNVIMGGHNNSLLQGKEYTTCLPERPTWPLVLSPIHHSSALNMLAE